MQIHRYHNNDFYVHSIIVVIPSRKAPDGSYSSLVWWRAQTKAAIKHAPPILRDVTVLKTSQFPSQPHHCAAKQQKWTVLKNAHPTYTVIALSREQMWQVLYAVWQDNGVIQTRMTSNILSLRLLKASCSCTTRSYIGLGPAHCDTRTCSCQLPVV